MFPVDAVPKRDGRVFDRFPKREFSDSWGSEGRLAELAVVAVAPAELERTKLGFEDVPRNIVVVKSSLPEKSILLMFLLSRD